MTPEEQSEAFRKAVREAEAAGDLVSAEADAAFERAMGKVAPPRKKVDDSGKSQ